jgi:acetyl esterase
VSIDPYSAAVLKRMAAVYPDVGGTVRDAALARRLHARAGFPAGPSVSAVRDVLVPGAPAVPMRIYWPSGLAADPLPVVVYFHGGGWVLCDLDTHDGVCRLLAAGAGAIVVAVDYRRAPEHRYPAAADDAYAAVCWVHRYASGLGGDPSRLVVAGDSAGGNLAAVTCLRARDLGGPALMGQLLIYPVTDCLAERPDQTEGYLLRSSHMTWFTRQYLASPEQALDAYASPLRALTLTGLPPAMVLTVGHDPLCSEGAAYASRLSRSGVPVASYHVEGLFHGVFGLGRLLPLARTTEDAACAWLREIIWGKRSPQTPWSPETAAIQTPAGGSRLLGQGPKDGSRKGRNRHEHYRSRHQHGPRQADGSGPSPGTPRWRR